MAKQIQVKAAQPKTRSSIQTEGPGFIEKHALKIAILLGVLALIIRVYRLGYLSLWVDEYMHALAAVNGKFSHNENNGILLTWFNTLFAYVLGHNEFSMRFPVALFGAALVPAVFVLGKRIANHRVGLMAAAMVAFSMYLIFWSRVDRPYGMVATMYVPLLLSFWLMLEKKPTAGSRWATFGIHPRYLLFTLLAFALSMLSQLICFLFIFSAGFYGMFAAIDSWVTKTSSPFKLNAYNLLFLLNILSVSLMFTPMGNALMRPVIELFLPGNMANLILPDMKAALAMTESDKLYTSFDVYAGVLKNDFKAVELLGWAGMILAFFKNRKLAYFLVSGFAVPFFLMGFIFREPVHAKYLSYIYPLFLISAAYALYFAAFQLGPYLSKSFTEKSKSYQTACLLVFCVLIFGFTKRKDIGSMLSTEKHGNIVDKSISEIHFVNWKQPCLFIKEQMKSGDIIMATVQQAPRFYLGLDSVVWFRQNHYDAKVKNYVPNTPDGRQKSAATYEQLVKTYNENPRGWLLADYYFDNALTDPRARQFVEQNFIYHFYACDDGGIKVFSWDKAKPKTYQSAFVVEMGKHPSKLASAPMNIELMKTGLPEKVNLVFTTEGIDSESEAFIIINDEHQIAIKPNGNASVVGINITQVSSSVFKDGVNKIQFAYNDQEGNGDIIKGCVIYSMDVR